MAISSLTNSYSQYAYGWLNRNQNKNPSSGVSGLNNLSGLNHSNSFNNLNSLYNLHNLIGLQNGTGYQQVHGVNPASAPFDLNQIYANAQNSLNSLMRDLGYQIDGADSTDGAKDYLTTIKTASAQMQSALGSLMGTTSPSAFQALAPVSSDTTKLTVESPVGNSNAYSKGFSGMEIAIDQIASKQVNQGLAMDSATKLGSPVLYEFSVESGGKSYQFSIASTESDTNQTLQEKIAEAINKKDIGLNAVVEKDTANHTSALKIEAKETGQKNAFVMQDVYGDAIGRNQADTATELARDAIYRLDGGADITSASNTIDLGNGLKATLLDATEEPVIVSMKADGSSVFQAMDRFVKSYNDLIAAAKSNDTEKSLKLNLQLASTIHTYAPSLGRAGIQMDTEGKLSINKDVMAASFKSGELEDMFRSDRYTNYGLAYRLNSIATEVNRNPMKYTDLSGLGLANYYSDIYSPFQTTKYNQAYSSGLFLNMFV